MLFHNNHFNNSFFLQRQIVLQRIFYAIVSKYHHKHNLNNPPGPLSPSKSAKHDTAGRGGEKDDKTLQTEQTKSGTDALIEMGVKTGLSLIFSLLRQQWALASMQGRNLVRICFDFKLNHFDARCQKSLGGIKQELSNKPGPVDNT